MALIPAILSGCGGSGSGSGSTILGVGNAQGAGFDATFSNAANTNANTNDFSPSNNSGMVHVFQSGNSYVMDLSFANSETATTRSFAIHVTKTLRFQQNDVFIFGQGSTTGTYSETAGISTRTWTFTGGTFAIEKVNGKFLKYKVTNATAAASSGGAAGTFIVNGSGSAVVEPN